MIHAQELTIDEKDLDKPVSVLMADGTQIDATWRDFIALRDAGMISLYVDRYGDVWGELLPQAYTAVDTNFGEL